MIAPSKPAAIRRRSVARGLAVSVAALLTVGMVAACSKTASTNGSGSLAGGTASASSSVASESPTSGPGASTPKPTKTKIVTSTPTTVTPSAPGTIKATILTPIFTKPPIKISLADCIHYDPAQAAIVNDGTTGFTIVASNAILLLVDSAADATNALALVRSYSQECFVGRNNAYSGNARYNHIVEYWQGTGVAGATTPTSDCVSYDNTALSVNNLGSNGYQVVAGSEALVLTDTAADATKIEAVIAAHHHLCFIGRGNSRPIRNEYIVEYWD